MTLSGPARTGVYPMSPRRFASGIPRPCDSFFRSRRFPATHAGNERNPVSKDRVSLSECCGLSLAGRTQHALALVHVEFLQLVAGRTQIFAGVELGGLVYEDLADGCGHRQTAVRVDVDLADGALGGLAELLFGVRIL